MSDDVVLNLLIVEDDADTRANLRDILELDGHQIDEAATAGEALDRLGNFAYDAILLDRQLPDGTAATVLPRLKRAAPAAPVMVVTGYADVGGAIEAIRQGAVDYLLKPIDADELRARLSRIVEHRRLQAERDESERFARSALDSLGAHIAVLDESGTVVAVNGAWQDFPAGSDGIETHVAEGENYLHACDSAAGTDADVAHAFAAGIREVLSGRRDTCELEYRSRSPEQQRWFLGRITPFQGSGPPRAVVAHVDITARKLAEERALQSERLAVIGQMVTGLTHESRNALQRGQACLEMLSFEVSDRPRAMDLIARLQKAQDDLQRLYEEVRDYAAPIHLKSQRCDLAQVWRTAWADLEPARRRRDAVLEEPTESANPACQLDPFRMGQVFRNLLENALAACPDPVRIAITCRPDALNGHPAWRISVRDNGPGLNAEQRQRVFDAFYTTKTKGTGLGLPICRRIIEAHHGQIALGDNTNSGAEFILLLPDGKADFTAESAERKTDNTSSINN